MSAFVRWFAVHPVQAFVWLYAHIEPMSMPACSSAAAASPAGVPRDAAGCARVGADGCRGFARGRAPAGSGRFRRKRVLILPWVLGFCAVFGGGRSLSASPTWGNVCAVRRFGPIRPAKPLRSCKRGSRATEVAHLEYVLRFGQCWSALAHEQALEAHRRAGDKPQARMMARRVRPRLPDGRPRQGEGQARLLLSLLREAKRPERPIRLDWPSALRWGRGGQTPAPPA